MRSFFVSLALVAMTLAVYWPVRNFEFVNLDDNGYVYKNNRVRSGMSTENVTWALTTSHFWNWHPLVWMSYMSDSSAFQIGPGGFHLTSVWFHAANSVLLFHFLRRMTHAEWKSAFVAALFAIHPLNVESVAWISCRKDVLFMFFGLLTLLGYHRYVSHANQQSRIRAYLFSISAFTLSLMSKQMLVTLPFLLLLLDYWPLRRLRIASTNATPDSEETKSAADSIDPCPFSKLLLEKLPYFALTLVFCFVAFASQEKGGGVGSIDEFPLRTRLANSAVVYAGVITKTVWPVDLAAFYPHPRDSLATNIVVPAIVLFVAVSLIAFRFCKTRPYLAIGWFWFVGTFLPVIGIVQLGKQQTADRYTYLPMIGLFIAVAWLSPAILSRRIVKPAVWAIACGFVVVFLVIAARMQVGYWRDSETLFRHAISVTKKNDVAQICLGDALQEQNHLDDAIAHFAKAVEIAPDNALAHNKLGYALQLAGEYDQSFAHFRKAVQLQPDNPTALSNLGNELHRRGQVDSAIEHYRKALKVNPHSVDALINLADAMTDLRELSTAADLYERAYELAPNNRLVIDRLVSFLVLVGQADAAKFRWDQAIAAYQRALRLQPRNVSARYSYGRALLLSGNSGAALIELTNVTREAPNFAEAHNDLGAILLRQGDHAAAANHFRRAIELKPEFTLAKQNLQRALGRQPDSAPKK